MDTGFGLVVPHPPIIVEGVGGARRTPAHATIAALESVVPAIESYAPETLVLISPHAPALADAVVIDDSLRLSGTLADFGDALPHAWRGDPELARTIASRLNELAVPTVLRSEEPRLRAGWLDHGSLVPLSFLDPEHVRRLVILSLSYLPYAQHRLIGEAVAQSVRVTARRVVFVASGDLSHRLTREAPAGFSERAGALDEAIVDGVKSGGLRALASIDAELVEAGGECGLRSFIALGGYLGEDPVPTRVLSYEGPWGVGYLVAVAGDEAVRAVAVGSEAPGSKGGSPGESESEIVTLARAAIEASVRGAAQPHPSLTGSYPERAGVFVSLHLGEHLRGCIGTILPTRETLAEEVIANAHEAALHDPRFAPVSPDEVGLLDVKVDVLHVPEKCEIEDLDPASFGVVVSDGWRRGLLLPDLEGVDDVETQVAIATAKAGIPAGSPCSYERFKVDRYT